MIKSRWIQRIGGGRLERMGIDIISRINFILLGGHKDKETVKLLKQVRRERQSLVTGFEAFIVHSMAKATRKLPGDIAEVGVFQGSTARLICDVKGDTKFRLFDTFEGLPKSSKEDNDVHREHQYTCSLDSVKGYLEGFSNLSFHKGYFPASAEEVPDADYSFVHLDVDLYNSTLDSLDYFYSRMVPGGILLSHDYSMLAGVKQAFTEFFDDKPEEVIELPTTQCMIVKLSPQSAVRDDPDRNENSLAASVL
jgi:O-methyltransferase